MATVFVVFAVASAGVAGLAGGENREDHTVRQEDECFEVTPLEGTDSVKAFYDYHTPFPDNPYTTEQGESYSSEGTVDLQEERTSLLFLYRDADGTLSLVMVHGSFGDGDGGSASFRIAGLPEDGRWAVKDDEYDGPSNYDRWGHGSTTARIDWTWGENATDGGAFEGLGDDFVVRVDPAFNEDAALYGQYYDGTVEDWQVLSGDRSDPDRTSLDLTEPVTISTEPCDDETTTTEDRDRDRDRDTEDRDEKTERDEETEEEEDRDETEEDRDERTERDDDRDEEKEDDDREEEREKEEDEEDDVRDEEKEDEEDDDRDEEREKEEDEDRDDDRDRDDDGDWEDDRDEEGDNDRDRDRNDGPFGDDGPFDDGPFGDDGSPFDDDGPVDDDDWPFDDDEEDR